MRSTSFKVAILFAAAVILQAAAVSSADARSAKDKHAGHGDHAAADAGSDHGTPSGGQAGASCPVTHLSHITTQAQAEALRPGDLMSMACAMCKSVMVQRVASGKAHAKMMTAGEKVMCHSCGGSVEVVATGKGEGKNAEVKHVCSKCGDDAMFCAAVTPGSGAMKDMKDMKKKKK